MANERDEIEKALRGESSTGGTDYSLSLDRVLARYVARLEQIADRMGASTSTTTVSESPRTSSEYAEAAKIVSSLGELNTNLKTFGETILNAVRTISTKETPIETSSIKKEIAKDQAKVNASDPSRQDSSSDNIKKLSGTIGSLDLSISTLKTVMDKINSTLEKGQTTTTGLGGRRESIKQTLTQAEEFAAQKAELEELVTPKFGGDEEQREKFIERIASMQAKGSRQTIKSQLSGIPQYTQEQFSKNLSNEDFIRYLRDINKYSSILTPSQTAEMRSASKDTSKQSLDTFFKELNEGTKGLSKFRMAVDTIAGTVTIGAARMMSAGIDYTTSVLNAPYSSSIDRMKREAAYNIQQGGRAGETGGSIAGILLAIGGVAAMTGGLGAMATLPALALAGTGATVGSMIGGSTGRYMASVSNLSSSRQAQNLSEILGTSISGEDVKQFNKLVGTGSPEELAKAAPMIRGFAGGAEPAKKFLERLADPKVREQVATAMGTPAASYAEIVNTMMNEERLRRLTGMTGTQVNRISQEYGYTAPQVVQQASRLTMSPLRFEGQSMSSLVEGYEQASQRSNMLGDLYTRYATSNLAERTTIDAYNKAFFGRDSQDILKGKVSQAEMLKSLDKRGMTASQLQMVNPMLYKELVAEGKEGGGRSIQQISEDMLTTQKDTLKSVNEIYNDLKTRQGTETKKMIEKSTAEGIKRMQTLDWKAQQNLTMYGSAY